MKSSKTYRPITSWDDVPVIFDIPMFMRLFGEKSHEYVRQRCKSGELPAFRHGKAYMFKKDDILEYIRRNSVTKGE